ncbi:MAG: hypothetical protein KC713_02820 [Candidatus Omnitrophica bacterium]|nr:hypothetical protein [Candidatus Omnitrophota bacterium]
MKMLNFKRQTVQGKEGVWSKMFWGIVVFKCILMALFSSNYQNELFVPFVTHFLQQGGNPWDYFYYQPTGVEFPYSPVMLYVFSLFYAPVVWLKMNGPVVQNVFFKFPTLLADIGLFILLNRMFQDTRKVLIFYFSTPIILYAAYMHSQVDLIPSAILFCSVYLLTQKRWVLSAVTFGAAVCAKLHVIAALPLMLIFIYKNQNLKKAAQYAIIVPVVFCCFAGWFFSPGYVELVLRNPKQSLLFDAVFTVGNRQIYISLLVAGLIYLRYSAFRKINHDLLYTFLALIFASFLVFTSPSPGWYVWLFPFLSIFFIKCYERQPFSLYLFAGINGMYLIYVIFFFKPEFVDLIFLDKVIDWKVTLPELKDISFTFLEVSLVACMYAFYKFGVKSNYLYKKNSPTVLGIAGDSAAGKTVLLSDIQKILQERLLKIEGDADHRWEREDAHWKSLTHLNPKANLLHRQYDDIIKLKYGKSVARADYDHATGRFTDKQKLKADDYIVLSGLHAFYLPKMRKVVDVKIYMDTDEQVRQRWKIMRDVKKRGKRLKDVIKQIESRKADAKRYILPQKDFADLIIRYFANHPFDAKDPNVAVRYQLRFTIDSNISLNWLAEELQKTCEVYWDYSEDLTSQNLTVEGEIEAEEVGRLASQMIANLEELLGERPQWEHGYRGLVQLMVVLIISEKIKMIHEGDRDAF